VGDEKTRYNIRVVDRTVSVLRLLSDGESRSLTDISRELNISNSSVFRILATLSSHKFIEKNQHSGGYKLGLSCLEMAGAYFKNVDFRQQALPVLERLRDKTSETVHLGILDDFEVVYLEKLHGLHAIGLMSSSIGGRSPSYCTGIGKAMLAFQDPDSIEPNMKKIQLKRFTENTITDLSALLLHLAEIRSQGYSFDEQEHEIGVCCIAAPIFSLSGSCIGAISISGPSERLDPVRDKTEPIQWIVEAASEISKSMGYSDSAV
jgi:IclR family KDG regulon transcriptional repressor